MHVFNPVSRWLSEPPPEAWAVPPEVADAYELPLGPVLEVPTAPQDAWDRAARPPSSEADGAGGFPNRKARVLRRSNGEPVLLWQASTSRARLTFALSCLAYASSRAAGLCPRPVLPRGGGVLPFVEARDGRLYYATTCEAAWVAGRACDYSTSEDATFAARALAALHRAADGFREVTPAERDPSSRGAAGVPTTQPRVSWWEGGPEQVLAVMRERLEELAEFKFLATHKLYRTNFDAAFLAWVERFCDQGARAMEALTEPQTIASWRKGWEWDGFCHHSLEGQAMVVTDRAGAETEGDGCREAHRGAIVSFESCGREPRAHDLCALVCRVGWATGWRGRAVVDVLTAYHSTCPVQPGDLRVAVGIARFPMRFWRLARRFYHNRKPWSEKAFRDRLATLTRFEQAREAVVGAGGLIEALASQVEYGGGLALSPDGPA